MSRLPIRLLLENLPEQRFVEAILGPEVAGGTIEVDSGLTTSGTVAMAELSLLRHPERPVAVILNTHTREPHQIAELSGPVSRILSRVGSNAWHLALAIPRLDAWAMIDERIRAAFLADPRTADEAKGYLDRAVRMKELVREQPFDREALRRDSSQFRGLLEFVERQTRSTRATSAAVAF